VSRSELGASGRPALDTTIRSIRVEDFDGIRAVWERAGFTGLDPEKFAHLFVRNPAMSLGQARGAECMGWVLEHSGKVRGVFGNLLTEYDLEGRRLLAATTSAVAVDPGLRQQAIPLISRFFRQSGVDLLLATTANAAVAPIYRGFRAKWVPHPDYQTVLYWIIDASAFARSVLVKMGMAQITQLAPLVGAALRTSELLRLRRMYVPGVVGCVASFGPEFDEFWSRLRKGPARLRGNRSASHLEWHFAPGRSKGGATTLVYRNGGLLEGYCIVLRIDSPTLGLRRAVIADLQVIEGRQDVVRCLVAAAIRSCIETGVHVLEARGFEPLKRSAVLSMNPRMRRSEVNPFLFKVPDKHLDGILDDSALWDPCPFDGDAAL
jgi:hypothetical protein